MYIYIYTYTYICLSIDIYIYIYKRVLNQPNDVLIHVEKVFNYSLLPKLTCPKQHYADQSTTIWRSPTRLEINHDKNMDSKGVYKCSQVQTRTRMILPWANGEIQLSDLWQSGFLVGAGMDACS